MLPGIRPLDLLPLVLQRARSVRVFAQHDGAFMVSIEREPNAFTVTQGADPAETLTRALVEFIASGR